MDPITLALIAAGVSIFLGMIYFFLKSKEAERNALEYYQATERARRELEEAHKRLEIEIEKRRRLEHEQRLDELRKLREELEANQKKFKEEESIASALLRIAGDYSLANAWLLIRLIYRSWFLRGNLRKPADAAPAVTQASQDLLNRISEAIERDNIYGKKVTDLFSEEA